MGQTGLDREQRETSLNLLTAVEFLVEEAERNGIGPIARILRVCASHMNLALTLDANPILTEPTNMNEINEELHDDRNA